MRVCVTILGIVAVWSAVECGQEAGQPIRLRVEARNLALGELGVMGENPFKLVIENHGRESIRLMAGQLRGWLARSPYWKLHVEGPIEQGCVEEQVQVAAESPLGRAPGVEVGPGKNWSVELPLAGVGTVGEYRVWVEYDGEGAAKGYFRGRLQSEEATIRIQAPTGIEADITALWREQNPNAPWCLFPVGMKPDITKPAVLFDEYPTSVYAGWALWHRLRGHSGGFAGPPSSADPSRFLAALDDQGSNVLYDERLSGPDVGHEIVYRREEAATWRIGKLRTFLGAHPTFIHADEMRLRIAMDNFGLGRGKDARAELERLLSSGHQTSAVARAGEYLTHQKQ